MKYLIAGYKLELQGEANDYLKEKMKEYESDFFISDMTIAYYVKDRIDVDVSDLDIKGAGRFAWHTDEADSLVSAYTYSETYGLYLAQIKWNKEFNRAEIYAIDSCLLGGPSIDVKLFGLVGQAFYYMLMMHHAFVIHASAISYKGSAILFSAPSGTGKSTQTLMWQKAFSDVICINDDNPVLRIIDDEVYVYGTPWAGKNSINANIVSKLRAIICIEQYEKIEISGLQGADAFFRLYNEINKPVLENMLNVYMDDLSALCCLADVYLMKCNLTEDTVYRVKELLELD